MEQLLVLVTLVSVAVATCTSLLAWRLRLGERARAAARVNALASAIEDEGSMSTTLDGPEAEVLVQAAVGAAAPPAPAPAPRAGADVVAHDASIATPRAAGMFAASQRPGDAPRRLAPAVAVGALIVLGAAGILLLAGGTRGEAAAVTARADAPVELLSLRHARQDGQFEITGLVRNAADGPVRERLTAVALLFDKQGTFQASGRALVDFTRLGAGEESPFRVSLADQVASAARTAARFAVRVNKPTMIPKTIRPSAGNRTTRGR